MPLWQTSGAQRVILTDNEAGKRKGPFTLADSRTRGSGTAFATSPRQRFPLESRPTRRTEPSNQRKTQEETMAITRYTVRNPAMSTWRDLEEVSNRLAV